MTLTPCAPASLATLLASHHFSLPTCKVQDVAKLSIKSYHRLTHCVHGCCALCPGLHTQLWVFIDCLLDDRYSIDRFVSMVVCQHVHLVLQHSHAVGVEAEPFMSKAHLSFILTVVVVVRTATFAPGSCCLVRLWGTLLLKNNRLLWGSTDRTSLFLSRIAGLFIRSIHGQIHQQPSNVTPILFKILCHCLGWHGL
jgi:hypothetical protein